MPILGDLHNRVALVTGASRGIGTAIAVALAEAGAAVAVNYRERAEAAETVAAAIRGRRGQALAVGADETDMMRARRDEMAARIPWAAWGQPEEVAQAVLMVIGNPYMTGQTVQLNGGANFI